MTRKSKSREILAHTLNQLDQLSPRSYVITRLVKEFPGVTRNISEEELYEVERRTLSGKPQGSAPAAVFKDLMQELRTVSDEQDTLDELSERLKFHVCPTPLPNARIARVEELSWRIDINIGMWSLLSAFARIVALSTSPQEAETQTPILPPEARRQLLANLVRLEIDAPELLAEVASRPLSDNDQERFAIVSADNAKRFVVAHELSHLFLGHLFQVKLKTEMATRRDFEESADKAAFDLLLKLAVTHAERKYAGTPHLEEQRRGAGIRAYLGVITALGTLLILEAGSERLRSPTHPPASMRLSNIRRHIEENHKGAAEALFRMSDAMELGYRHKAHEISTDNANG